MKRKKFLVPAAFWITLLLGAGCIIYFKSSPPSPPYNLRARHAAPLHPTPYPLQPAGASRRALTSSRSVFVPYWAGEVSEKDMNYEIYYYFGVRPEAKGVLENEPGLQNIPLVKNIPEKQKKIVLRMFDATVTEAILQENAAQKMLISQMLTIMNENAFSGIVLDIEVPFTLQADKKEQITRLVQQICTEIKSDYKTCDLLIYGDFSYRNRPYDVKALGGVVDTILLMAYDFHKAVGEPGPNFPYEKNSTYDYDFQTMIQDTIALVPKNKIEVVFGMYGYDWTLNEQGTPLKGATALSLKSIQSKVLKSEGLKVKSNDAREKSFEYVDAEGLKHIVWYEDEESAALKIKYLLEQGISQVSYWAYTYY